ncbi:MAG TPA: hypothetical protein VFS01_03030 [Rhizomicrobium sp.]|nr:hypothetical protein [Rhizomicrobium sp.]
MRIAAPILISLIAGAAATSAVAQPAQPASVQQDGKLLFTPSGYGDPEAVVCRAPQKLEDSGGYGPEICLRNSVWLLLTQSAKDLSADGKSVFKRPLVEEPHGKGPPLAVTCRKPATITASRTWRGPVVCLENKTWAALYARDLTVTGDGRVVSTRMSGPATDATGMPMIQTGPPPRNAPVIGGYYSPL